MSVNLPTHYVQQFSTNIQLLLQQKGSKLRDRVMSGSHVGKQASPVDQIGAINMQPRTTRFAPMGRVDAPTDRRWVFPSDFDLPQLVDSIDKLRMITDPQSAFVQNAVMAAGRQFDDLIIDAFFADAKTGETGSTTTQFGTTTSATTGQNVSASHEASATTGLTFAKLREAKRVLMANQVDLEADPLTCIVTSRQHDDLLKEVQVTNLDYTNRAVLDEGKVTRVLGIDIVHCERLDTGTDDLAATSRMVPVFAKSGMYLGIWDDIKTSVSQRNDLQGEPWQAYVTMTAGATRLEEKKVVRIWCDE